MAISYRGLAVAVTAAFLRFRCLRDSRTLTRTSFRYLSFIGFGRTLTRVRGLAIAIDTSHNLGTRLTS